MIREEKNIDFYTTGKQPSEAEFARISEWIKKDKAKKGLPKSTTLRESSYSRKENIVPGGANTTQHQHL